MRICCVIHSLARSGGAEKIMAWLAEGLAGRGHEVTLLTLAAPGEEAWLQPKPSVRVLSLGLASASPNVLAATLATIRRVRVLRAAILAQAPDAVLSFMDRVNVLTLLAVAGRLPVVAAERTDPGVHRPGRVWSALRRLTFSRARAVAVQTPAARDGFPAAVRGRCRVIANPVFPPAPGGAAWTPGGPLIAGLGRLEREKGFDVLLRAFALSAPERPDWRLAVYGDGSERANLERLRDDLGLSERVFFPGFTDAPQTVLREADVFVLPSRYEGFPNALAEALAQGVASLATATAGSAAIVRHGRDGLLVPPGDERALARELARLMDDGALRARLAGNGPGVLERFTPEDVLDQWEQLLSAARGQG
ncbi:glycosyltransferase family 4 protein [Desulfovibrio aminophilus]|nr:glycosyltransferase family 4 protein [Desulfovibrio aminophilus]MCM0755940.1 glycosyltransferase family 4 protein [Desulfovibrio aminophilus]